jgi:hypothetical protein
MLTHLGTTSALALAGFLLVWYVVGMQVKRRRAAVLMRQVRDSVLPMGGNATIRWIGRNAFRVEVEKLPAPYVHLSVSLLLEPYETCILWVVGRLRGRRDWLVTAVKLVDRVAGSFEVYHPRRRGAFQVSRDIREKGWREEPLPGRPPLRCAAPDADGRSLAQQVVTILGGQEVWRVALQPEKPNLILSLPLPSSETRIPLPVFACLPQLVKTVAARRSAS